MKKLIVIFLLLFSVSAFPVSVFADITTFQNFGNLKLIISLPSVNPADAKATYMLATGAIPDDGTLTGNLYDANDNLVAQRRVYSYSGGSKDIPFSDLTAGQQGYLSGEAPVNKWDVAEIKLWLADRQAKDEAGNVSVNDPYHFTDKDTKETLLSKIGKAAVEPKK